jgi:hypothetical protein
VQSTSDLQSAVAAEARKVVRFQLDAFACGHNNFTRTLARPKATETGRLDQPAGEVDLSLLFAAAVARNLSNSAALAISHQDG